MAIPGTIPVTGILAPTTTGDTYPVYNPIYGLGSLRTVDSLSDRDSITTLRREEGMMVYVKEDLTYYTLTSGLTNSDWVNLNFTNGGNNYTSQYAVTVSGTNAYSGTAVPTLTAYSITDIYLTQFENTNTTTAVTLDISTLGPLDIFKGTESGLTSLDIGEIQTGVTYFLTYDGSGFQFFDSSPAGTPGTYTNLSPTTVTVGGLVAGTTFSASTWQSMFTTMLYPTLTPNFSAFALRTGATSGSSIQTQLLEVGNSVSGGTKAFTWTTTNSAFVQPNSIKIYSGATQISTPASGMANDSFEAITLTNTRRTTPGSFSWSIKATRTNLSTFTSSFGVTWYWRRMFGVSSATTITTSADVNTFSGSGVLTNTMLSTYTFTGPGYKYFFVPTVFGMPSLFKDFSTNLSIAMADVTDDPFFSGVSGSYYYGTTSVTNQFGIATNYRVYRTRNYLNGNITIVVT
jgi:hypothetical protein